MKNRITTVILCSLSAIFIFIFLASGNVKAQKIVDNVYQLTDKDFDKYTKSGIVLVDFWAVWCGPCRIQGPIVDEIAQEIGQKAIIAKLDVDAARITSSRFNIKYIPTIIIFNNGSPAIRLTGVQNKQALLDTINTLK
jgi:thioredoxin 1